MHTLSSRASSCSQKLHPPRGGVPQPPPHPSVVSVPLARALMTANELARLRAYRLFPTYFPKGKTKNQGARNKRRRSATQADCEGIDDEGDAMECEECEEDA